MAGSSHLKPGDSGVINVSVDMRNRIDGKFIKTVEVFSNDPKRPKVILTLKAGF